MKEQELSVHVEALEGVVKILLGAVYEGDLLTQSQYRTLYDRLSDPKPTYRDLLGRERESFR